MSDPGGGYGWRAGRVGGHRRVAERATLPHDERALGVLLLPTELEVFGLRVPAENLLTAPGVLAVEPARISSPGIPGAVADGLAATQARRLRLPGAPRAIVIFHPLQYALARALFALHPDAELWYWLDEVAEETSRRRRERLAELHEAAAFRAALTVVSSEAERERERAAGRESVLVPPASDVAVVHAHNRPLWERLEALGVESGRLGSERAAVTGSVRTRSAARAARRARSPDPEG